MLKCFHYPIFALASSCLDYVQYIYTNSSCSDILFNVLLKNEFLPLFAICYENQSLNNVIVEMVDRHLCTKPLSFVHSLFKKTHYTMKESM